MVQFIQKLGSLWSKSNQLTNILLEREFISTNYAEQLADDELVYQEEANKLRDKLKKFVQDKKDIPDGLNEEISELDQKAKEVVYYKTLVSTSHKSEQEIKDFIKIIKKSLWN